VVDKNKSWEKLFEPYTRNGCTVERMIMWLNGEGQSFGFGSEAIQLALMEVFLELQGSPHKFIGRCDCGCQENFSSGQGAAHNIHTWINHHVHRRCQEIQQDLERNMRIVLEKETNRRIKEYRKEHSIWFKPLKKLWQDNIRRSK